MRWIVKRMARTPTMLGSAKPARFKAGFRTSMLPLISRGDSFEWSVIVLGRPYFNSICMKPNRSRHFHRLKSYPSVANPAIVGGDESRGEIA